MKVLGCILFIFLYFGSTAQTPTIGLIVNNSPEDGYILFAPEFNNDVYLINNCGEIVNHWLLNEAPGKTCYLLENGNLLYAGRDSVTIKDWDNNTVWSYATTENNIKQHHDIEPLPNGNILLITTETVTQNELIALGKNPSEISNTFKTDKIVEIQPIGDNDAQIVWEWSFLEHLIQDFDNSKANFGVVADHPELIDINYIEGNLNDWTHANGIDYHAELDQIILSARNTNEIYIIDHSTTANEAKGHTGGNAGKGGDFLWRWGNPQVYDAGTANDQKLFGQHDPKWIPAGYVNENQITVFNNGGDGVNLASSICRLTPTLTGTYNYEINSTFLPYDFSYTWQGNVEGNVFYGAKKSGTHSLPNGNMLVCQSNGGLAFEVNTLGDVVWVYTNPTGQTIFDQGYVISSNENPVFRFEKYPIDFPGFNGKDLTPSTIIENENSVSLACNSDLTTNEQDLQIRITNPVIDGQLEISSNKDIKGVELWSLNGRMLDSWTEINHFISVDNISTGFYFIVVRTNNAQLSYKILIE